MCQYSAVDGFANDWHLVHLGSRAIGGVGLLFKKLQQFRQKAAFRQDLRIWKDEQIEKLQQINQFISGQNAVPEYS
jgi:2,4-dienoyl-CoA reductase-like NADH-dependent reductase (Old Yellow Enzyme family)